MKHEKEVGMGKEESKTEGNILYFLPLHALILKNVISGRNVQTEESNFGLGRIPLILILRALWLLSITTF